MNLIILAMAAAIILIVSMVTLIIFERRIRKELKSRLEVEQDYRHQLEKLYLELSDEFVKHMLHYH